MFSAKNLGDLPAVLVERLYHYFETYKLASGRENLMSVVGRGDRQEAEGIVTAAMADYEDWRAQDVEQK